MTPAAPFVEVRHLKVYFPLSQGLIWRRTSGWVRAVDDVSLAIRRGETVGLVGESGCGKTTVGRAIVQLHRPTAGQIFFDGQELGQLGAEALRRTRRHFQMVFQDPYASLNPRLTVAEIVGEPLVVHGYGTRPARRARVAELLELVGLNAGYASRYPHEFSGGQRQRIG
ncbi:MAG TPA: ATP-binding cassette domain-containing protein, partial [Chloroflexota bacterium]